VSEFRAEDAADAAGHAERAIDLKERAVGGGSDAGVSAGQGTYDRLGRGRDRQPGAHAEQDHAGQDPAVGRRGRSEGSLPRSRRRPRWGGGRSERTVAIGHGKKAARNIGAWLRRTHYSAPGKHPLAAFGGLNTWYYADAPATVRPTLEAARRVTTFDEVVSGLDESTALFEARRCMSCGNCFGCDNCYGVCPDNAIVKLADGQYAIDHDYCKGCGLCAAECPSGAIEMQPEQA
jgi:2-oxoacid:acceptor oxidoreductase delta subunit (pyruvate/2-ketoisovalerate family)